MTESTKQSEALNICQDIKDVNKKNNKSLFLK